jgi:serine/threonine protein kinase
MVADFGIALAVSAAAGGRMTETGLSLGTPHYMSPEQATAEKEITGRSGRELFYKSGGQLVVLPVTPGAALSLGSPQPLFSVAPYRSATNRKQYDVAPDGPSLPHDPRGRQKRRRGGVRRGLVPGAPGENAAVSGTPRPVTGHTERSGTSTYSPVRPS